MFALNIVYGMASFMTIPITWAMIADTADFAEWKFGIRSTGIVFSAATFAHKLGIGIGGGLGGWLLSVFGYIPGVSQTSTAVLGIKSMMSIFPAAGAILVACLIFLYKIDENMCHKMQEDLAKQRPEG
jgi:GPH family glycoside/pentoside/hexuronide:cation symporter